MSKNITWDDRADNSTPTNETTEAAATIFNTMKAFHNNPSQDLSTFDGLTLVIDGTGSYTNFTMAAHLSITFAESAHEKGNIHIVKITTDGSYNLTFVKPAGIVLTNFTGLTNGAQLASGVYMLMFFFDGTNINISKLSGSNITNAGPTLDSIAVNSDNTAVTLTFSVGSYANNNGTGDLLVNDFTAQLASGTATNPVLSVPTHSAGDSTAAFTLSYTGTANGAEVLTITPANDASVYEVGGTAMDSGETANDNLKDQTAPTLISATIENATDDILDLVKSESVNITITGWGIDTDGAALSIISVASGDGTSTPKLQLSRSVLNTETLNIDYDSGVGDTTDTATIPNTLASITDEAVVNNVASGYTFANTHSMVTGGSDGAEITADTFWPKNGGEQPFSWGLWVKTPNSFDSTKVIELENGDSARTFNFTITTGAALRAKIRNTDTNWFQKGTANSFLTTNTWYHIVVTYDGDYTGGTASLNMYVDGSVQGSFTSGGTFVGIDDLAAGSKLIIPELGDDGWKFNFSRFYDADMSANIATIYNSGVVPDLSGEGYFSNIKSEMPFNNDLTALVGPDGSTVGSPTFDTDLPT
ncbi:MAG: LamG-like jellyroll fold domain-containing protein [Ignavibacteriaceae bacterium]